MVELLEYHYQLYYNSNFAKKVTGFGKIVWPPINSQYIMTKFYLFIFFFTYYKLAKCCIWVFTAKMGICSLRPKQASSKMFLFWNYLAIYSCFMLGVLIIFTSLVSEHGKHICFLAMLCLLWPKHWYIPLNFWFIYSTSHWAKRLTLLLTILDFVEMYYMNINEL